MLAPRKNLWSTPQNVLDVVCEWISLKADDVVCDIGCGDGRVLLQLASHWTALHNNNNDNNTTDNQQDDNSVELLSVSFVGLDINPDRVQEACQALEAAKHEGKIHPHLSISFHCANAMESIHLFQNATVFFLYLIPRGLRIFKPLLLEVLKRRQETRVANNNENSASTCNAKVKTETLLQVVTYMSPLPGEKFEKRQVCQVDHQPGAGWPLYLYNLTRASLPELGEKENKR